MTSPAMSSIRSRHIPGASVETSQAMDRVCSDMDVITLTCDDEEDDLLGPGSPALSLELEEREIVTLLASPTPSPSPSPAPPAPQSSNTYASSDLRDRMSAEQLAA